MVHMIWTLGSIFKYSGCSQQQNHDPCAVLTGPSTHSADLENTIFFRKKEPIPICRTSEVIEFENCCDVACERLSSSFTFKSFISSFRLSIEY